MQLPPTMLQEGLIRNMLHDFLLSATLYNEMHSKVIGTIVSAQNNLHLLSLKQKGCSKYRRITSIAVFLQDNKVPDM